MKRIVITVAAGSAALATAAGGVAAVNVVAAQAANQAPFQVQAIDWTRCAEAELRKAQVQCGVVVVPLDHDKPEGEKLRIAVSRHRATAPAAQRLGVLLNNGGLSFAASNPLGKAVQDRYDLIGVDTRGTGASRPLFTCGGPAPLRAPQPAYQPSARVDEAPGANERAWLARWNTLRTGCEAKYGDQLRFYTTDDLARDTDLVRRALGAERVSLYNGFFSRGELAQAYATMFPAGVERMVLQYLYAERSFGYAGVHGFARTTGMDTRRFWSWVASHHDVYGLGRTAARVQARYEGIERELERNRAGRVGASEWSDSVALAASFDESAWPDAASVFAKWVRGNRKPLLTSYADPDPGATADQSAAFAQTCGDSTWPANYTTWRRDTFRAETLDPGLAWSYAMYYLGCRSWPVQDQLPAFGADAPKMLLIGGSGDPRSYGDALRTRQIFGSLVLLEVRDSVTNTEFAGNPCVDRAVRNFLLAPETPDRKLGNGPDLTCAAPKLPKPLKADVRSAASRDD